jgi:hypothetical protein
MAKKLKSYIVPVNVSIEGYITVKAKNKAEALELAKDAYDGINSLGATSRYVDFPNCDDIEEDG